MSGLLAPYLATYKTYPGAVEPHSTVERCVPNAKAVPNSRQKPLAAEANLKGYVVQLAREIA
jgi:hypothetical protein